MGETGALGGAGGGREKRGGEGMRGEGRKGEEEEVGHSPREM